MRLRLKQAAVALGLVALMLPAAAAAKREKGNRPAIVKDPVVMYVFQGTYAGDGAVEVAAGNGHVRKAGLVGQAVAFDLSAAKLSVADTNGDASVDASDVLAGDQVLVQARLPKRDPGAAPYAARKLVDKTNPEQEEVEPVEPAE